MKIPKATFNMGAQGRAKPRMSKADKDFVRGYAACMAAAISLEDWRPSQISGGLSRFDFETAGVEQCDIKTITECVE